MSFLLAHQAAAIASARARLESDSWINDPGRLVVLETRADVDKLLRVVDDLLTQLDAAARFVPQSKLGDFLAVLERASYAALMSKVRPTSPDQ